MADRRVIDLNFKTIRKGCFMKRLETFLVTVLFLSVISFIGCGDQQQAEKQEAKKPEKEVSMEDVKEKSGEALEGLAEYTEQQKEVFQQEIQDQIESFDKKINNLQENAANLQGEAKQELNEKIARLEAMKKNAGEKLESLKGKSGEAWAEMKEGISDSITELQQAYDDAMNELN